MNLDGERLMGRTFFEVVGGDVDLEREEENESVSLAIFRWMWRSERWNLLQVLQPCLVKTCSLRVILG